MALESTSISASITHRLRRETADAHAALERELPLGTDRLTPTLYQSTMADFWGFYATWEEQAQETSSPSLQALVRARRKLHLLEADLLALSHSANLLWELRSAPMDPGWLPDLREPANLLGSMYVVEGATLGGQIIAGHLEAELLMSYGWGYSFFVGYGRDTGLRWKAFCSILESTPEADGDQIVASAQQTFTAFRRWLEYSRSLHRGRTPAP